MKNNFFREVLFTIINRGISVIVGFVGGVLLARLLGPVNKGVFAVIMSIQAVSLPFSEAGIRQAAAYIIGKGEKSVKSLIPTMTILSAVSVIVASAVMFLLLTLLGYFRDYGAGLMFIFILYTDVLIISDYLTGIMTAMRETVKMNLKDLALKISFVLLFPLFCFLMKNNLLASGAAAISSAFVALFMILVWLRKFIRFEGGFDGDLALKMFKYGFMFSFTLFILQLNYRIDNMILEKISGEAAVGIYSVGVGFSEILKQFTASIGFVFFTRSVNWKGRVCDFEKALMLNRITFILNLIIAVFILIFSDNMIKLFYGSSYFGSSSVVKLLLIGVVFLGLFHNLQIYAAGQGFPQIALYAFIPGAVINIILNIILIPRNSYLGAATASAISYAFSVIVYLAVFSKKFSTSISDMVLVKRSDFRYFVKGWRSK